MVSGDATSDVEGRYNAFEIGSGRVGGADPLDDLGEVDPLVERPQARTMRGVEALTHPLAPHVVGHNEVPELREEWTLPGALPIPTEAMHEHRERPPTGSRRGLPH